MCKVSNYRNACLIRLSVWEYGSIRLISNTSSTVPDPICIIPVVFFLLSTPFPLFWTGVFDTRWFKKSPQKIFGAIRRKSWKAFEKVELSRFLFLGRERTVTELDPYIKSGPSRVLAASSSVLVRLKTTRSAIASRAAFRVLCRMVSLGESKVWCRNNDTSSSISKTYSIFPGVGVFVLKKTGFGWGFSDQVKCRYLYWF